MAVATFRFHADNQLASSWERALGVQGTHLDLMEQVEKGLPAAVFDRFSTLIGVPREELASAIHTTTRTIARRKRAEMALDRTAGERLVRLALLYKRSSEILGDEDLTRQWMRTPREAFGGRTPFEMASSEIGAEEVEDLLTRVEQGVFY
jgi:putative toxin-antitoxin system antitoxin component (TIGR02293 family)